MKVRLPSLGIEVLLVYTSQIMNTTVRKRQVPDVQYHTSAFSAG